MENEALEILKALQKDMTGMKTDMTSMKQDMISIKQDMTSIKQEISEMKGDISLLKVSQTESMAILRALEQSSEVNKAEHDKMSNEISHLQGDVTSIKHDLNRIELATANNWADIAKLKAVR